MTNTPPSRSQSTGNGSPRRHSSVHHRGRGGRMNSNAGGLPSTAANASRGAAVPRGRVEAVYEALRDKNVVVEAVGALTAEAREDSRRQRLYDQLRRARRLRNVMEKAASEAEGPEVLPQQHQQPDDDAAVSNLEGESGSRGGTASMSGTERARNMLLRHREDINELVSLTEAVRGGYTLDSYDHYTVMERIEERKREEAIQKAKLIVMDQLREMAEERSPALKVLNRAQRKFDEAMRPTISNVNGFARDPIDKNMGAATATGVSTTMTNAIPDTEDEHEPHSPEHGARRQVLSAESNDTSTKYKRKKKRSSEVVATSRGKAVDKSEKQKNRKKRKKKLDLSPEGDVSFIDSSALLRPMPAESHEQSVVSSQKGRVATHGPKQDYPANDGTAAVESQPALREKDQPPSPTKKDRPAQPFSHPPIFGNQSPNHEVSPQIQQQESHATDLSPSSAAADKTTSANTKVTSKADSGKPSAVSPPKRKRRAGGAVSGVSANKELKPRKCHDCKLSSASYHRCQFWNMNGTKCGKAYCSTCLTTRYGVEDFETVRLDDEWFCPACLGKCLCRPCKKERERVERRTAHNATRRSAARVSDKFYAQFG